VLSRLCNRVVIIDRDDAPGDDGARAGVPQARHAHVILDRGRRELEYCVPGFERRIVERGGQLIDPGCEFAALGAVWMPRVATDGRMVCATRDLVDSTVRQLVGGLANLELRTRSEVTALELTGRKVTGVVVQRRGGGESEQLRADLVVDASGRSSKLPQLLAQAGLQAPEELVIEAGTWYSTRWFRAKLERPASHWWRAVLIGPSLKGPGALLTPIEGDRCIVSIASVGLGQPKIDDANFEDTLRNLRSPVIAESIGEPLSPVYGYRATANRIRYYERLAPVAGLVAVGDAACALNPIHGQGVSCTARCAHLLEEQVLRHGLTNPALAPSFLKAQAEWMRGPWGSATSFDLSYPHTVGKRPLAPKLLAPYFKLFAEQFHCDAGLLREYSDVGQLNRPFSELLTPRKVARVLSGAAQRRWRRQPSPIAPFTPYPSHEIRA
jgi:2-polyprenyl-6-methoxyphenol hydroxylase-like FAD-dependent oxidoreductase